MQNRDAAEAALALDRAIEYIHQHGWCKNVVQDDEGRVCLQGAVMQGAFGTFREKRYRDTFDYCWNALYLALGSLPVLWNDLICRDADEAVEALKKAKEFL